MTRCFRASYSDVEKWYYDMTRSPKLDRSSFDDIDVIFFVVKFREYVAVLR